jgi:hypothetical protein
MQNDECKRKNGDSKSIIGNARRRTNVTQRRKEHQSLRGVPLFLLGKTKQSVHGWIASQTTLAMTRFFGSLCAADLCVTLFSFPTEFSRSGLG